MGRPRSYQEAEFQPFEWTWRVRRGARMLRPDEACVDVMLGVLGRAQAHFGDDFQLYFGTSESTHIHLDCAARDARVAAAVKCFLATNMSKEIQALRGVPRGGLWDRPCRALAILDGQMEARLIYALGHGYKSNLVDRVADWPGLGMLPAVLEGAPLEGTWYDRDRYQRALWTWRRREAVIKRSSDPEAVARLRAVQGPRPALSQFATRYPVTLTPPPGWAELPVAAQRARWQGLVAQAEQTFAAGRRGPALGLARVLAMNPKRASRRPMRRSSAPPVHGDGAQRRAWLARYRVFAATYGACVAALAGSGVAFPWEGWLKPGLVDLVAPEPEIAALA